MSRMGGIFLRLHHVLHYRLIFNRTEKERDNRIEREFLPDTHEKSPQSKEATDPKLDAKVEAMATEYTHMLTNQV